MNRTRTIGRKKIGAWLLPVSMSLLILQFVLAFTTSLLATDSSISTQLLHLIPYALLLTSLYLVAGKSEPVPGAQSVEQASTGLKTLRVVALFGLAAGGGLAAWALFSERQTLMFFGAVAHFFLWLFVGTEAFGPIALQRSRTSRLLARIFFVLSSIVVVGMVAHLLQIWLS